MYPDCPGAVRLGIGLCRYKLGQFEKARQAFERVMQVIKLGLLLLWHFFRDKAKIIHVNRSVCKMHTS